MSTPVAGFQVLRWSWRRFASLASGLHGGRLVRPPIHVSCKPLSSSSHHIVKSSTQDDGTSYHRQPVTVLSVQSFLDMGFTDTQAELLQQTVSGAKGSAAAQQTLSVLTALFVLGLNPSSVLKVLEKCPELHHIKESQFNRRINNLRKMGLVEGSLQRVVAHYPQILTVPVKRIRTVVMFIREKCLFTVQQVTEILRDSPAVIQEDLDRLEYKFQYVFFRMGVKQAEMVKSRLFRFSVEEVRRRHSFLERRGLYQTPDKKGQTLRENPPLSRILHLDLETFLADVARATAAEYDTFGKMVEREWQEEEQQERDMGADSDDDEEEEEEEDDDHEDEHVEQEVEVGGNKRAYTKKRKT